MVMILVAEGEGRSRRMLRRFLEGQGMTTRGASTLEEALAILREGRVELTVMGLGAPVKAMEKSARISLKLPPKLNEASDSLCQSLLTGLLVYLQAMGEEYPENLTILLDDDDEKE